VDDAWCIYTYVHKGPRFPPDVSSLYRKVTPSSLAHPRARRRPGDVLFDGVSKREILTEQLSPAGIMWADGWRERFDFHGISGERGIVAKERERARGRGKETERGRDERRRGQVGDGSHRESTRRTSPFRIPWYPGDTGRA